jgi:drug/metabolite transporter (DMT)-like permease
MNANDNVIHAASVTHPGFPAKLAAYEGPIFGALAVLMWSLSMVATRAAAPELGGLFVGFGRGAVAGVLAVGVLRHTGARFPDRRHWAGLAAVALGSVIGFPVLAALALASVPASHGLVFTALLPLATAAVAVVRTGERPGGRFWMFGMLGAAVVVSYALGGGAGGLHIADLQLVAGMLLSAIAYVEGARLSKELGGVTVLSWALVLSLPVTAPTVLWLTARTPLAASPGAWLGFAYVSIFSMYLGFLAWYRGLASGGIARVSRLQSLQPLLGLAWSALLLGETLSPALLLTAATVIVCVALGRGE